MLKELNRTALIMRQKSLSKERSLRMIECIRAEGEGRGIRTRAC